MTQTISKRRRATLASLAGLTLILMLTSACERIAPIRTLPTWVRGVYIPVFKNKTVEPQIEETVTKLTQEAFLDDGRVDVVPKAQADLMLVAEIVEWKSKTDSLSGDHIAFTSDVEVTAGVKLYEPFDLTTPVADLGLVRATSNFDTDTRSVGYQPEPDRKEALLRQLANQILNQVITGFPTALRDLPAGVNVPQVQTPQSIRQEDVLAPRTGSDAQYH